MFITGIGKVFFSDKVSGSLIKEEGVVRGSTLIGQNFNSPQYFWSRPSATVTYPYNALASGASNLGPLNPEVIFAVNSRTAALQAIDPYNEMAIPVDLVTASASGLDPHISLSSALYQLNRVANARGVPAAMVENILAELTHPPRFGIIGHAYVNVVLLNAALDTQLQK